MTWIAPYQTWLSEGQSLNNAQQIVNHFVGSDWSKESLSAMIGNMRHESSINPDMYEYGYEWGADRGYGLVQWTPRSKYWDWAVARGLPPRHGDSQLARIDYEVENNIQWIPRSDYGNMTFKQFRTNSGNWTVEYLTEAFTWGYERPNQEAGNESMPARKAFARRAFNELDWTGTGGGGGECQPPAFPTTEGLPITSKYGWRDDPINGGQQFHTGIDIGGQGVNHPIYATQTGKVILNQFSDTAGYYMIIQHTAPQDNYFSRYLHLAEKSPINVGETVTRGQEIAIMGTTGNSTGIHLDFGISTKADGFQGEQYTIDPELYLAMEFCGGGGGSDSKTKEKKIIELLLSDCLNGWKY